jgi:hypothetical protein
MQTARVGKEGISKARELAKQAKPDSQEWLSHPGLPFAGFGASRGDGVARALRPRLEGLNITTDLMQVGEVVTGQQS